jgi:DNA-binding CsgD family transcriptional regulator
MVPYSGACWHTMDPATLLLTGNVIEDIPDGGLPMLAKCEYGMKDINKWSFLAKRDILVGRLDAATQGRPELSHRYRALLRPAGLHRELRASFVDRGSCWGSCGFYRSADEPEFTDEEEAFVRSLAPLMGLGYRRALVLDLLHDTEPSHGPGLVVLDASNAIEAISAGAQSWLAELDRETARDGGLPIPVLSLSERVRSRQRGNGGEVSATLRVRGHSGKWLVIHATPLTGTGDGRIGLTIEAARPPELARLLVSAFGLSQREQEVAYGVLRGESTKEIACALKISPYTVQDHLKEIFRKLNVNSRRKLVSRIYSEHYLPMVAAGRSPTPDGWFGSGIKPTAVNGR